MITLGFDPGLNGAFAALRDGKEVLGVWDMPVKQSGTGGSRVQKMVDAEALYRTLNDFYFKFAASLNPDICALVERTTAMPGQGVSSMYSMGHSRGVVEGVLAALSIPVHLVPPAVWKRNMGYTADKEPIRSEMHRVFPSAELHLKKHADRAEAIAMALYIYRQKK